MIEKLPFKEEKINENVFIRLFPKKVEFDELKWHWDEEDREFEILEGVGWWFQRDNDLPIEMKIGDIIKVSKGEWHRAIKDKNTTNDLVIKLTKFRDK